MSTCMQTAKNKARVEIFDVLASEMRISTKQMDEILCRHGIRRDPEELQRAYRLSVGQQIVAGVRDKDGKREILASRLDGDTEYIVLEACNDPEKLKEIQYRLSSQIAGLSGTVEKVGGRTGFFDGFRSRMWFPRRHR